MKTLTKILSLLILGTLVISGCSVVTNDDEQKTAAPTVMNADNVLDQQIYQRAIGAKDAKACATIKDVTIETECGDVVNSLVLTDTAVAKVDAKLCGGIKLDRYKEECKNTIASIVEQKDAAKKQQELIVKQEADRQKIEEEAKSTGDYKLCDKIANENQKASCQYNVIAPLGDAKNCKLISNESLSKACEEFVSVK